MVEHLPSICEAIGSILSPTQKGKILLKIFQPLYINENKLPSQSTKEFIVHNKNGILKSLEKKYIIE
jgi:hypothetical protein